MGKKYKIGLVLGGGGSRGIAHLGVARAMYEKGLKPDVISGVSAGSIAGVMLAAGLAPDHIFDRIKSYGFFKYSKIIIPKIGLFRLEGLEDLLHKEIKEKKIEDLKTDLWITASNISDGKVEYFNKGPLFKCVMASSSIPVIFEPVEIDGSFYVDGGLYDNLPIEPIKDDCDHIIAVNLAPHRKNVRFDNLFQVAFRAFHLSIESNTLLSKKACDIIIEPNELDKFDILQLKDADKLYELGYKYALEALKNLE